MCYNKNVVKLLLMSIKVNNVFYELYYIAYYTLVTDIIYYSADIVYFSL